MWRRPVAGTWWVAAAIHPDDSHYARTALLIVDMVRRIRRVRYRAQVEEDRMAAAAAADVEAAEAAEAGAPGQQARGGAAQGTADDGTDPAQDQRP